MSHEEIDSRLSPFDCVVCGGSIYGQNLSMRICLPCKSFYKRHVLLPANTLKCIRNGQCSIEKTQRYFSSDIPPCRACRLQKCLSIQIHENNSTRPRSTSSPPLNSNQTFNNNNFITTNSFDEYSNKDISSNSSSLIDNDQIIFDRIRCLSDATDRLQSF